MWGQKTYDVTINPRYELIETLKKKFRKKFINFKFEFDVWIIWSENSFVTYQSYGEGYHNYHHTFPFDYSASELDWKYNWNFSTLFIDLFACIGWAYDRKKVSIDIIRARIIRTGDIALSNRNFTSSDLWFRRSISLIIAMSHLWIPFLFRSLTCLIN
jgi:hypothetical protein